MARAGNKIKISHRSHNTQGAPDARGLGQRLLGRHIRPTAPPLRRLSRALRRTVVEEGDGYGLVSPC